MPRWGQGVQVIWARFEADSPYNFADHTGCEPALVAEARALFQKRFPALEPVVWLNQVHRTGVLDLDKEFEKRVVADRTADAVITRLPNRACCVLTADCVPILLYDQSTLQCGAIHGGWRGLAGGIVKECLARFEQPGRVRALIGPCISKLHYSVGRDVVHAFGSDDQCYFERQSEETWSADLPSIAQCQLERLGVSSVTQSGLCTMSHEKWPSYRRDKTPQRLASFIWRL